MGGTFNTSTIDFQFNLLWNTKKNDSKSKSQIHFVEPIANLGDEKGDFFYIN